MERGFVTESLGEEWLRSLGTLGLEERTLKDSVFKGSRFVPGGPSEQRLT